MPLLDIHQMTEEDVKTHFITPAIQRKGWTDFMSMETQITDGKVNLRGNLVVREKPKRVDYLLYIDANHPIAVLEAKDNAQAYEEAVINAFVHNRWLDGNAFDGIVAASPSVWYPGLMEFAERNRCRAPSVYLSLGDAEDRTRNPVMRTVGDNIRKQHELLKEQGVNSILEWNPGNHFVDSDKRTAAGFAWIMQNATQ